MNFQQTARCSVLLLLALGAAGFARASDITYNVDLSVGATGSVVGDIVTNGAIGQITQGDIVNWNLTIKDASGSVQLNDANSQYAINNNVGTSSDVDATATNLTFNFSSTNSGEFYIESSIYDFVCFGRSQGECASGNLGNVEGIAVDGREQNTPLTGTQVIASVSSVSPPPPTVPEPGFDGLIGLVLLGAAALVRRKSVVS